MDLLSAGIVLLLFIALIVFSVFSAKTWHWSNIVLVNLIFIAAIAASIGMSKAYNLRHKDMAELDRQNQARDRFEKEAQQALHGSPESILYDPDSLRYKAQQVRLSFTGRGRVWTNGQIEIDGDRRAFIFNQPRPEGGQDAPVTPLALRDTELLLFADDDVLGSPYPTHYIGRVVVVEESPERIVLSGVKTGGQSEIVDQREWDNPTTTWTLFEKMPLDDHDTFKMAILARIEINKEEATPEELELAEKIRQQELDISTYRQLLENLYLPADLFNLSPDSREYEAIIDRFAFDGYSLGKIENWVEENAGNRKSQQFVPADDEVLIEYRFDANSNDEYIVDSATGAVVTDGPFTALGLAVDQSLHQGAPIRFSTGDVVRIDQRTADGMRGNEVITPFRTRETVTEIDRIYVRKLKDYPMLFNDISLRSQFMEMETARAEALAQRQQAALASTQQQETERNNIKIGMEQDIENLQQDVEVVDQLIASRSEQLQTMQQSILQIRLQLSEQYRRIQEISLLIEKAAFAGR